MTKRFVSKGITGASLLGLCLILIGCTLPRGAAFQNEVLKVAEDSSLETPEFQVETVTRLGLHRFSQWPQASGHSLGWIAHKPQPSGSLIAAGDLLNLTIWDTGENSLLTSAGAKNVELKNVPVSPAGKIFLPYIGQFKVSGMSPEHARDRIEEKFATIVASAQVQLTHSPGRKNEVSLVDGVRTPGNYPLQGRDVSLLSAISQAGGVASSLTNPQVHLIRNRRIYGTSLSRLTSDPQLDTVLRGGDKVIVKEDERYFLSLGATGSEALHEFSKDHISTLDALSTIGGVSDNRANPKGILVLRNYPSSALRKNGTGPHKERVVFVVDLTSADGLFSAGKFPIQSGDLIYATESQITSARTVFGLISSVFGVASQVNNNL